MPEQSDALEIVCVRCKEKFLAEDIAQPSVINEKRISMLVWVHVQLVHCPKCLMAYQPILANCNVRTAWGVVPCQEDRQERKRVIVPPASLS